MMLNSSKSQKVALTLFVTAFICLSTLPIMASATDVVRDYSTITPDIADHIIVRTGINNFVRNIGYTILKFLADFIDLIYDSVDTIIGINLYTIIKSQFDFSSYFVPLAWAIVSAALVVIAIRILIRGDEGQIKEDIRKYIICILLIIILPGFITSASDLKNALKSDMDDISVSGSDTSWSLGNQILGEFVIDVFDTVDTGEITTYSDSSSSVIPTSLNINAVFDNIHNFKVKVTDEATSTYTFGQVYNLSWQGICVSMGLRDLYSEYLVAKETGTTITRGTYDVVVGEDGVGHPTYVFKEFTADEFASHYMLPVAKFSTYSDTLQRILGVNALDYTTWSAFEKATLNALEKFEETLKNGSANTSIKDEFGNNTQHYLAPLFNDNDERDMLNSASIDNIGAYFHWLGKYFFGFGYAAESVYKYDFNFLYGLIVMLATLLALIFACFRLGKLLYEVVFIEIIAPIFIAIDSATSQEQKAKQVLTNLVSSYALFIFVILILKLYLMVVLSIFQLNLTLVVKIVIIISGAAFVIDGPDIVVKLLGVDAGVKSGYGALRGMGAVAHAGMGAAKKLSGAPTSIATKLGERKGTKMAKQQAAAEAKKDGKSFIGQRMASIHAGMANGRVGSAYKKAATDRSRANSDYKAQAGNLADIESSSQSADSHSTPAQGGSSSQSSPSVTNPSRTNNTSTNSSQSTDSHSTPAQSGSSSQSSPSTTSPTKSKNTDNSNSAKTTPTKRYKWKKSRKASEKAEQDAHRY